MSLLVLLVGVVVAVLIGIGALVGGAALFGLIALAALVAIGWLVWALVFHGREVAEHVRELPPGGDAHLGPGGVAPGMSPADDPERAAGDEQSRAA